MSEYSISELRDMAPAYVLGALNADEHAAFEAALKNSSELAAEVSEFGVIMERIGSANSVTPSPQLRSRFLDKIAANKPALTTTETPGVTSTDAVIAPFTVIDGGASRAAQTAAPRGRWWLTGALAAALAASLVFAVNRNSQIGQLTAQLAERDSVIKLRDLKLSQRDTTLNTVLEAERDLVVVNLTSVPNGAGVQFFWNMKQGRGLIHAFRLKPAAPGRTYELWLIKDGKPVPIKVFNSDSDQRSLVWGFDLPKEATGVSAVAITDEPEGGSPQPTTTPFLVGAVPKTGQ